jgi:tryptophanyl-tRNA synthetase
VYAGCRSAGIGCIECKTWAADALLTVLKPMQERRQHYEQNPREAWQVLEEGAVRAREAAEATMEEVRDAMKMSKHYEAPAEGAAQ